MVIDEKNKRELKAYLLREFCAGNKWVAFDHKAQHLTCDDVQCFRTLAAGSGFCERMRDDCYGQVEPSYYYLKHLGATLREMSGVSVSDKIDTGRLQEEINKHPLEGCHERQNIVNELAKGELCPAFYKKTIDLPDIQNYTLIAHWYPRGLVYEIGHQFKVLNSFKELDEGLGVLKSEAAHVSRPVEGQRPELLLIGEIKNKKLQLDYEAVPDKNTGFVFAIANPQSHSAIESEYDIQKLWTGKPFDLKEPLLAKFNTMNSSLEFYDGNLKKISPQDTIEYFDFRYFDTRPFQIVNLQKKTIAGDEQLNQQEEQQKFTERLKHRMS